MMALFILATVFFIELFLFTAVNSALKRLHRRDSKKIFKLIGKFFFYRTLCIRFFPKNDYEGILFSILIAQSICRMIVLCCLSIGLYEVILVGTLPWPIYAGIIFFMALFFSLSATTFLATSDHDILPASSLLARF